MAYFPLFVNLEGRRVLVVGGGKIAARRIRTLLEFGCEITVVAPEVGEELLEMLETDAGTVYAEEERKSEKVTPGSCRIIWKRKKYEIKEPEAISADLMETDKFTFVLAAATPEINAQVVRECRKKNIPVNNASDRDQCDFYFPGIAKDGDTVVGITSGGRDHKLAAKISQAVRNVLHV